MPPDGFTLESCTTSVADAGSSGWRNFEDFKARIIDQSKTRVMSFLNIVGHGMGGDKIEQNLADMEAKPTADMALEHKGVSVGIKSAHYSGPEWEPYIRAVEAGTTANVPVMVDFGSARVRTIAELFSLRDGPSTPARTIPRACDLNDDLCDLSARLVAGSWDMKRRSVPAARLLDAERVERAR